MLEVQLGVDAPLGLSGAAMDIAILDAWSLGVGVGVSPSGMQLAAHTRVRLVGTHRDAFHLELAYSTGRYRFYDIGAPARAVADDVFRQNAPTHDRQYEFSVERAAWLHLGAGYEHRWHRFSLRGSAGLAILLNRDAGRCFGDYTHQERDCRNPEPGVYNDGYMMQILPYTVVGLGYTM